MGHSPSQPMTEETLVFICDEAACKADLMFYEVFNMDDRWTIIRAILKAVETAAPHVRDLARSQTNPEGI